MTSGSIVLIVLTSVIICLQSTLIVLQVVAMKRGPHPHRER
jgi:hypothetical protein